MLVLSTPAFAIEEPVCSGVYIGGFGGAGSFSDFRFEDLSNNETGRHNPLAKVKPGYIFGGLLGYKFESHYRLEFEVAYRSNDLDKVKFREHYRPGEGHFSEISYMANALVDIIVDCEWTPFFGVGAGYADSKLHVHRFDQTQRSRFTHQGLATQFIAGLAYNLRPDLDTSLQYRYYVTRLASENCLLFSLRQYF